jgi:cell division protein YceG involved in septum cleavage
VNPAVPQKRRLPIPVFLAAIALLLIVLAALGFVLTSPTGAGSFTLEIKRGTTLPDAVKQLQSRGVIRSPDVFRMVRIAA